MSCPTCGSPRCRYCGKHPDGCNCERGPCLSAEHEILRIALSIRGVAASYEGWLRRTDLHISQRVQDNITGYMGSVREMSDAIARLVREMEE